jgi:hypothetical protein
MKMHVIRGNLPRILICLGLMAGCLAGVAGAGEERWVACWSAPIGYHYGFQVLPACYAYYRPVLNSCIVLTVDRQTLQATDCVWPGKEVYPLDSAQSRVLTVLRTGPATRIELLNSRRDVLRQWTMPIITHRSFFDGTHLIIISSREAWLLDPESPELRRLDNMFISEYCEQNGAYQLAWQYGGKQLALFRDYQLVWRKSLDYELTGVRLAKNGSVLTCQSKENRDLPEEGDGKPHIKHHTVFTLITAKGEDRLLVDIPMAGRLFALSDNGAYALAGTRDGFKVLATDGPRLLWEGTVPVDYIVPQTLITDDGRLITWEGRIVVAEGTRTRVSSRIRVWDAQGTVLQSTESIGARSAVLNYSIVETDGHIDFLTHMGLFRMSFTN